MKKFSDEDFEHIEKELTIENCKEFDSKKDNIIYHWGKFLQIEYVFDFYLKNFREIFTNKETVEKIFNEYCYSEPYNIEYVFEFLYSNFEKELFSENGYGMKFLKNFFDFNNRHQFNIFEETYPFIPDIILFFTKFSLKVCPDFFKENEIYSTDMNKLLTTKEWVDLIIQNS